MKTVAPSYYKDFKCIADKCKHTCCVGWEIDIDQESLPRFCTDELTKGKISLTDTPHIELLDGEKCPFLLENGLCDMIIKRSEDFLCDICRDHPRFRNFWQGRTDIGLGLVCEESARIILSQKEPLKLIVLEDDGKKEETPPDEKFLQDKMAELLEPLKSDLSPLARLKEYFIFRHVPNALYDDRLEERVAFVNNCTRFIDKKWAETDYNFEKMVEIVRKFSYDVEYDEEITEKLLLGQTTLDKIFNR